MKCRLPATGKGATTMSGTSNGAKIAPIFAPVLKIPVATERSFGGNHSVTTRIAAGKFPDSPRPSAKRARLQNPAYGAAERMRHGRRDSKK